MGKMNDLTSGAFDLCETLVEMGEPNAHIMMNGPNGEKYLCFVAQGLEAVVFDELLRKFADDHATSVDSFTQDERGGEFTQIQDKKETIH